MNNRSGGTMADGGDWGGSGGSCRCRLWLRLGGLGGGEGSGDWRGKEEERRECG